MNDFKLEYETLRPDIDEAMKRVFRSGWHILGSEVAAFEEEFAAYLGAKYVIGVANGLEAIQIGLMALGIRPGDEVITTSLSAVATALAITNIGGVPVFCDVDEYFHLDPKQIEKKISRKTKAILPVHLYGQMADVITIKKICSKYGLELIEDAAQAHGAGYMGKKAGTFGEIGAFSFYPTKNLGAYGDAGAISTNSVVLARRCRLLRNYGQKKRYEHLLLGLNSRLDEMQASILRVKLRRLDQWNKRRQKIAAMYDEAFENNDSILRPLRRDRYDHVFHQYVIKIKDRPRVQKKLVKVGIESLVHYPTPIHKQPCYSDYATESYPRTEADCLEVLSLPINPLLTDSQVKFVVKALNEIVK